MLAWSQKQQQCHPWRALSSSPFGKHRLPLAGCEPTYECVCGRLSVIALPACPAPGTTLLAACVVPWARAPGSSNRLLECPFAALRTHWPSPTWEPTFCAKLQEPRMSVTWTPTGPLAGFVFFSLRVWGKESPTGWEGELLAFSLSLAICCLLRQACLERVCIKWMQAAIP